MAARARRSKGKPMKTALFRHSKKQGGTPTGLSREGVGLARKTGRQLPEGLRVKLRASGSEKYASQSVRAQNTARLIGEGYLKSRRGATYGEPRVLKELGFDFIHDMEALEQFIGNNEDRAIRLWLDGKIPRQFEGMIDPAQEVADKCIHKMFRAGQRVAKGGEGIYIPGASHSWVVEAVFERLTGHRFDRTVPPKGTGKEKMVRPLEGLVVTHYPNGRAELQYRGKRYGITKKLNAIIAAEGRKARKEGREWTRRAGLRK